jgi:hypothetical protein
VAWRAIGGVVLVLLGLVGTVVWVGAFSPYGFVRFELVRADRTVTVSRAGEYLVFEEGPGAGRADLPPAVVVSVTDERGRLLEVEDLVPPGERGAPFSYHVPPHEGRAIARFEAPRAGLYWLQVEPLDLDERERAGYRDELPDGLAFGRQLDWSWLRTPLGVVVLGLVPLAAGTVLLVAAARRRRRSRAGTAPEAREPVR